MDPSLPAGAVIGARGADGLWTRNDGKKLIDCEENPWYRLATVYGVQDGERVDWELHAKNRRVWNAWMVHGMAKAEIAEIAAKMELELADFEMTAEDEAALAARFADGLIKPRQGETIDLRHLYFSHQNSVWERYYFGGTASFSSSTFRGNADFGSSAFIGSAFFPSSTFGREANFVSSTFSMHAFFGSSMFSGPANFWSSAFKGAAFFGSSTFTGPTSFGSITFSDSAFFESSTFSASAYFRSSTFSGPAYFSEGTFKAKTSFRDALFKREVPEFYHREMHQDLAFSSGQGDQAQWPAFNRETDRKIVDDGKRAYERLAQIARELDKTDDEQFFRRQEMRCKELLATGFWERLGFGFYRIVSDFGGSFERPLGWLGYFWLCGALWIGGALATNGGPCVFRAGFGETVLTFGKAAAMSLGNLLAFLGVNRLFFVEDLRALPAGLQVVSGFQMVSGVILLFFLGLGLRNRFRLK